MKISYIERVGNWRNVADAARTTVGMESGIGEPSSRWKKKILLAEHSPIRQLVFRWKWERLPSWVSVHFVRHKFGIEHFVKSQRTDRTGIRRDELPQNTPVTHECIANAQAIINISRKRLCSQSSPKTREAWIMFLDELRLVEPDLYLACVPECIYRGFCPEMKPCGYFQSSEFEKEIEKYRSKK